MAVLRKLLRLTKHAYAVTLPRPLREVLKLVSGDYVEVSLYDQKTIAVRKHQGPVK